MLLPVIARPHVCTAHRVVQPVSVFVRCARASAASGARGFTDRRCPADMVLASPRDAPASQDFAARASRASGTVGRRKSNATQVQRPWLFSANNRIEPNKLSEAYGLSGTQACRAHSSVALWGWHVIARTDIATLHDYQTTLRHHSGRTLTHFHPPLPNGNRQASQSLRNSVGSRFGGGSVPSQRLSR